MMDSEQGEEGMDGGKEEIRAKNTGLLKKKVGQNLHIFMSKGPCPYY